MAAGGVAFYPVSRTIVLVRGRDIRIQDEPSCFPFDLSDQRSDNTQEVSCQPS